jgi:hypothetical protein
MTPIPAQTDIFTALRAILLTIVPSGTEVVQGQDNRVPAPTSTNYVVMTDANRTRLSTNTEDWDRVGTNPTVVTTSMAAGIDIDLDVHGPASADIAVAIAQTWRSAYAVQFKAEGGYAITPQYASEPRQSVFINGEDQYERRWIVTVTAQAASSLDVPAQFSTGIAATVEPPADAR